MDTIIYRNGRIAELRKSRKQFRCEACLEPIEAGSQYYSIVIGGSGLGGLKFPSRCHVQCLDKCLDKFFDRLSDNACRSWLGALSSPPMNH